MKFDEKVKFLRTLPSFKVAPINEVRAVAFAAGEKPNDIILSETPLLTLSIKDVRQILHEYPHLEAILK